jgi:LAO/AO transport system kinase
MLDLLSDLKKGKRGAIAKAITIVENDQPEAKKILKKIFKDTGKSIVIGITGPAGAGKSSLINKTTVAMRKLSTKPAVLAVDPTSHVTGGAILGDRVRMTESTDSGTYIRSIASRGATGAVSRSLRNSIRILEYAGFNPIIIESVGAGQTEVEISNIADITVVVFNPHTGDSIQTIKAGLTEIGDIYLVNKSDLDGTNQLFDAVRDFIGASERNPIILKTSVKKNSGISQFAKTLKEMMGQKRKLKMEKDKERLETELKELDSDKTFSKYLKKLQTKDIDPFEAADKITKSLIK